MIAMITEDELFRLDSLDQKYEVFDGKLVPMSLHGVLHSEIAFNLAILLHGFVRNQKFGYVFGPNLLIVLRARDGGVLDGRCPDVTFIRRGRFPKGFDLARGFPGSPDLAVEVISTDNATILMGKIQDYLAEGSEEVWVIYPKLRTLHRHLRDDPDNISIYHEDDTLEPESLFPGLKIPIAACFENA
jgi:Uma2 family endonuclease